MEKDLSTPHDSVPSDLVTHESPTHGSPTHDLIDMDEVSFVSSRTEAFFVNNDSISSLDETTVRLRCDPTDHEKVALLDPHIAPIEEWADANDLSFETVRFHPGDHLLKQGEPASGLFIIDEGSVRVVDREDGHVIDRQNAPGVFGEISLLTGDPCSADVIAEVETVARVLSARDYYNCQSNDSHVETILGGLTSSRLGHHVHDALCGKEFGGYRIERCIARGGMGVVYEANPVDAPESTRVAIKMLMHRYIGDESMQRRFSDEASILQRLDHPHINQMTDHFSQYRTHFLVLEYCDGTDMSNYLRTRGVPSNEEIRALLGQIASGLAAAHDQEVIHRDLKLANLLINQQGTVQIADFGLSRLREMETSSHLLVGTPTYMAPELFRRVDSGVRADYYSLGCLLYQLVTGSDLFRRESLGNLIKTKKRFRPEETLTSEYLESRREAVHAKDAAVDKDIRQWMITALQADPDARNLDLAAMAID